MDYANSLDIRSPGPDDPETIPVFVRWFGSWQISVRRRALSLPQLARFYDLAAPGWSRRLDRLGVPGAYEAVLSRLVSEVVPAASGAQLRVLDCGVGTGALSCALGRVVPVPFKLDVVDVSLGMLERANSRLRETGLNATLCYSDVRKMPYADGEFDVVMSAHLLEHLADPLVALKEMARVLKPGGLLIAFLTRRSALGAFVQLKWRTHRVTPDQAESWLRDSGLENARCLPFGRRAVCGQLSVACVARKPLDHIHR